MKTLSIRERVFYLMRRHDVELAETFLRRCPDVKDVVELNTFFQQILSQYSQDSFSAREVLSDSLSLEQWLSQFEQAVLPLLRRERFPPMTAKEVNPFYGIFQQPVVA